MGAGCAWALASVKAGCSRHAQRLCCCCVHPAAEKQPAHGWDVGAAPTHAGAPPHARTAFALPPQRLQLREALPRPHQLVHAVEHLGMARHAGWPWVERVAGTQVRGGGRRRRLTCSAPPGPLARPLGPTCFRLSSYLPAAKSGCPFSSSGIRLEQKRATSGPPWPSNTPKIWQSSLRCSAMCASSCTRGQWGRPVGAGVWGPPRCCHSDLGAVRPR